MLRSSRQTPRDGLPIILAVSLDGAYRRQVGARARLLSRGLSSGKQPLRQVSRLVEMHPCLGGWRGRHSNAALGVA